MDREPHHTNIEVVGNADAEPEKNEEIIEVLETSRPGVVLTVKVLATSLEDTQPMDAGTTFGPEILRNLPPVKLVDPAELDFPHEELERIKR